MRHKAPPKSLTPFDPSEYPSSAPIFHPRALYFALRFAHFINVQNSKIHPPGCILDAKWCHILAYFYPSSKPENRPF